MCLSISFLFYLNNVYDFEKTARQVIDLVSGKEVKSNIPESVVIAWLTTEFENWTLYLYNPQVFPSPHNLVDTHPNIHPSHYKNTIITYQNAIFSVWIRKNSPDALMRYLIIPFLINILIAFILKFIFLTILNTAFAKEDLYSNEELSIQEQEQEKELKQEDPHVPKNYDLTNDELNGLLH